VVAQLHAVGDLARSTDDRVVNARLTPLKFTIKFFKSVLHGINDILADHLSHICIVSVHPLEHRLVGLDRDDGFDIEEHLDSRIFTDEHLVALKASYAHRAGLAVEVLDEGENINHVLEVDVAASQVFALAMNHVDNTVALRIPPVAPVRVLEDGVNIRLAERALLNPIMSLSALVVKDTFAVVE